MKILGLDYGTKRIGVAVSDEGRSFALPKTVLSNDDKIIKNLRNIVEEDGIERIVVGDPGENRVLDAVKEFSALLEKEFNLPVIMEKEFMTSMHVSQASGKKPIARQEKQDRSPKRDDSAAALILQRYLDKQVSRK